MSRRPLIAGNWKMNGSRAEADELARGIASLNRNETAESLVCPPYPYLGLVADALSGSTVVLGAQNVSEQQNGAYTGEVSAAMLVDMGCSYVIVGHSERRQFYGEDSALVAVKARVAAQGALRPIICVGELLAERENGRTEAVISEQLEAVFAEPAET